ncbi:GNAT family N-acetyltransferase [Lachnoclostridium sp.]|uniref:GNAT family N-acetyltransferase n=1 Tax=Lachnoclostridium sp. TaxID=2028282 RepID=UPI00289B44E3|nr:GNAT family N-acetyltransferase [Lachnoclostridium sp.]
MKGKAYFRILGFVIDNRYRNKGIGSEALKMAIQYIYHEYGKVAFLLECNKENLTAVRFYEKLGFKNTYIINKQSKDYFMMKDVEA